MEWTNAKIEQAFIGLEGHGIFAWSLMFSAPGWGQGTGMRGLGAESLPTIKAITTHFGPWNELEGKLVRVGRNSFNGPIVAMRDLLDDRKEVVFND